MAIRRPVTMLGREQPGPQMPLPAFPMAPGGPTQAGDPYRSKERPTERMEPTVPGMGGGGGTETAPTVTRRPPPMMREPGGPGMGGGQAAPPQPKSPMPLAGQPPRQTVASGAQPFNPLPAPSPRMMASPLAGLTGGLRGGGLGAAPGMGMQGAGDPSALIKQLLQQLMQGGGR